MLIIDLLSFMPKCMSVDVIAALAMYPGVSVNVVGAIRTHANYAHVERAG